mgnify:CR=1 FL=1
MAAAELLARRLRAVNARLETPPWLRWCRELPVCGGWREAARCERLRANTRLHDGTIAQVDAPAPKCFLVSYRPLAPCRLCIRVLQAFSYHFNHSAGSATP